MNDEQLTTPEDNLPPDAINRSGTLRLLFYDHWFRFFAIFFLLLLLVLAAVLPRVWVRSPPNFEPPVKVSALDLFQGWSLARKAKAQSDARHYKESMLAWSAAMMNDMADPRYIRGALNTILAQPGPPREYLPFGYERGMRLLRLRGTNLVDLDLFTEFLSRYNLPEYVTNLAAARAAELPPTSAATLLRAYFETDSMAAFGAYWNTRSNEFAADPGLALYRLAWEANWGPPAGAQSARQRLAAARRNPDTGTLATRLQLAVSYALQDDAAFEDALNQLRDTNVDRVMDHVNYWRLLRETGHARDAERRVHEFARPPETPNDVVSLAVTYELLGLNETGLKLMERENSRFGFSPEFWVTQSRLLARLRRWDDLRALAVAMRSAEALGGSLDGYAYYLEGLAEGNLDRLENSREAMRRAATGRFPEPELAFNTGKAMRSGGHPAAASELFERWRTNFTTRSEFWFAFTAAAFEAGETERLVTAARTAYELKPKDTDHINNYAAALLATRRDPQLAIRLTVDVLGRRPQDHGAQINHALALAQNDRADEAEKLLREINTLNLPAPEVSLYNLAWFEVHWRRRANDQARLSYARIDHRHLLAPVVQWLDETYKKIPAG